MSNLIPPTPGSVERGSRVNRLLQPVDRRTGRELTSIERRTLTRMARVRGESMVQVEKTQEIDRLAREAMSGQAMLSKWAGVLSQGDPFLADEMKLYADLAKMAKAEIIADTVTSFCQEGR